MNLIAVLLATSLASTTPADFTARTVDGRQIHGCLSGWDEQAVALKVGEKLERLPLGQLLSVEATPAAEAVPASNTVWVTLADGSVIAAGSFMADAATVKLTTSSMGLMNLPAVSVDSVRFRPVSPEIESRWKEIMEQKSDQDMLVIGSGDTLDYLGGIVRAVREQEIDFELDGESVPVRRGKVFGIRYFRPHQSEAAEPIAGLTGKDGSTWSLRRAEISQSGTEIVAVTPAGIHVVLPLSAVARIDFAADSLVFLSDLTADSYQWTPSFGLVETVPSLEKLYSPRRNTTLDSTPLVLDGMRYEHGLTLHSRAEVMYRLGEPFERFQSLVGIDDRLRPRGNVDLKILGDDRVLYSETIAGTEPARPIDISLKGVKTLTILVDFGSDLDVGDHLILAEARLLK